jgi:hypothetical protein
VLVRKTGARRDGHPDTVPHAHHVDRCPGHDDRRAVLVRHGGAAAHQAERHLRHPAAGFGDRTALGGSLPNGTDAFVVGKAEPTIGRIGYLNCRYGVTGRGAAARPAIEVGISLYRTAAQAAARIPATVDDYSAHGATASDVTVTGLPAQLLTGGTGDGYDVPLLVVASGQRTVAVSVDSTVATGSKAKADAIAITRLALDRTSG